MPKQNLSQVWRLWEWWGAGGRSLPSWAGSRGGIDSMAGTSWTLLRRCWHREQTQREQPHDGYKKYRSLWWQGLNNLLQFLFISKRTWCSKYKNKLSKRWRKKKTNGKKNRHACPKHTNKPSGNIHTLMPVSVQYLLRDSSSARNQAGSWGSWLRLLAAVHVSKKEQGRRSWEI